MSKHSLAGLSPLFLISFNPLKISDKCKSYRADWFDLPDKEKKKPVTYQPAADTDIKSLCGTVPGFCHWKLVRDC